jgi:DNA-binding NarL/FixJ family response regulator
MIRVLIADDFADTRIVLRAALETSPQIRVCGEATCGEEAFDQAKQLKPDAIVLDLRMPSGNGIEAASKISSVLPNTPIALISVYSDIAEGAASKAGVTRFFCKTDIGGIRSWIEELHAPKPPIPDSATVPAPAAVDGPAPDAAVPDAAALSSTQSPIQ